MHKAMDIANFFVQLSNSIPDDSISNLKLNKMLYFAQGWMLAVNDRPLFEEDFEAWDYGPVIREVYDAYKPCGKWPIKEAADSFDESSLDSQELELLADVYNAYGKYTGYALANMTYQKGTPWEKVHVYKANNLISKDSMRTFFKAQPLERFKLNQDALNIITQVPSEWDNQEDDAYDSM